MTEIELVESFLSALEALDIDRALELVDPAIVYQNNSLPPARGIRAFERQMRLMNRLGDHFEARVHHIAQDGRVVLTQRTDVLGIKGQRIEFWVWGRFEVADDRIVLWHDYFDWAQFSGRALLSLPGLAVRSLARAIPR